MGRTARPVKATREDIEEDRRFVTALARGLDVLRCFGPTDKWLANQEIARRTDLPKPTVSRITFTLTALGYLDHSPEREKYAIGLPVLGLGFRVLAHFDVGRIARPFMQELADRAHGAVSLAVRHGNEVVYVAHCRSNAPLTLGLDIGARLPLLRSAIGHAVFLTLPAQEQGRILAQQPLPQADGESHLQANLAQAANNLSARGFVVTAPGAPVGAAAVPVVLGDGREPMGLNCGGPASAFPQDKLDNEVGPLLVQVAAEICAAIRSEN